MQRLSINLKLKNLQYFKRYTFRKHEESIMSQHLASLRTLLLSECTVHNGVVEGGSGGLSPLLKIMRDFGGLSPLLQTPFRPDKFVTTHFPEEKKGKIRFYQ